MADDQTEEMEDTIREDVDEAEIRDTDIVFDCPHCGKNLVIKIGFSHDGVRGAPEDVAYETPNQNTIVVKGIDKQVVGALAADIRSIRKPEPYHGKGIKYIDEHVRRKEGKTGKK